MKKKIIAYGLSAIVLLSIIAIVMPVSAQPTAESFGVNDASGDAGTYVIVPVNITNAQNGPIASAIFDISYDTGILTVVGRERGDLTSNWDLPYYHNFDWGTRVSANYDGVTEHAIQNGSIGSVVLLNFSVAEVPGATSKMNLTNIQLSDISGMEVGTAPAKNGTFRVDAGAPIVINPSANPDTIVADGTDKTELNVTVTDDIADCNVTINLTSIGGDPVTYMNNIGNYTVGDVVWCIFNYTTTAAIGTPEGTHHLQVNATDLLGNYNNTVNITLNIESPVNGSIIGKIMYSNNGTGIAGVNVNLTKGGSVEATTMTNGTGYYNFTDVTPDSYFVNASKSRFWDNSTDVTVSPGMTEVVDMMLWLKGNLNNNGISADAGDLVLMKRASVAEIPGDWRYNLNNNDMIADAGDLVLMKRASVGEIVLI